MTLFKLKTCQHFLFNISFACRGLQHIAYFWLMSGKIFVILVTTDTIFCHATFNSHLTGYRFLLKVFLKELMYSICYYCPPLNFSGFKFISSVVAISPNYYAAKMSLHYYMNSNTVESGFLKLVGRDTKGRTLLLLELSLVLVNLQVSIPI